jgi:hypothetical protein
MSTADEATTTPDAPKQRLSDDAEIFRLGAEIEAAWKREDELIEAAKDTPEDAPEHGALEAQVDVAGDLIDQLLKLRAGSVEALQVKARAIAWCQAGSGEAITIIDPDRKAATDMRLAQSIVEDLLALGA